MRETMAVAGKIGEIRRIAGTGAMLALLAAGCGAESRPSHADFVKEVRKICSATQARHDRAAKGFDVKSFDPDSSDLSTIVPLIERNVAIGRDAARELSNVRGPEEDEARVRRFVATARRLHTLGDKEARAARRRDRAAFKSLIAEEDALHKELGDDPDLKGC